ncbi:MAG: serine hydrolase domain-containing protein [Gemmatimonadaceae bacterium]
MSRRRLFGGALGIAGRGAPGRQAGAESLVARTRAAHGVPALGGMVVTPEGTELLEVAGTRRAEGSAAVTTDDPWHLGSNTKAMTAALYARMVQMGHARWGATMRELFDGLAVDPVWHDSRPLPVQRRAAAETVLRQEPKATRDTFAYANANYVIAGAAMERLRGGAPWEELMRATLFAPTGMASAGFGAPTGAAPWGHTRKWLGLGALTPVDPTGIADNPPVLGPAGTVHATLGDYAKFLRLFLTDGGDVLAADSLARLTAPFQGGDQSYGLGWIAFTSRPWAKGRALAHEGSNTLWHAFTAVGPARRRAVVAVCNTEAGGGSAACQDLGTQLLRTLG